MSHTINISGYALTCDSEYSGVCRISNLCDPHWSPVEIPCDILLQFAAEYIRSRRISSLEDEHWDELLK